MKILIIGNNNVFSIKIMQYLKNQDKIEYILSNNMNNLQNDIINKKITNVIYDNRKYYNKNIWNTSFIEDKLDINIKYNLYYPLHVCNICKIYNSVKVYEILLCTVLYVYTVYNGLWYSTVLGTSIV